MYHDDPFSRANAFDNDPEDDRQVWLYQRLEQAEPPRGAE